MKIGLVMTWYALVGIALLIVTVGISPVREAINSNGALLTLLNLHGFLLAWSMFGSWGLAIFHWGLKYPVEDPAKMRWGLAVVLGMFVGAWVYWLLAAKNGDAKRGQLATT